VGSLYRVKAHSDAREDRLERLGPDRFEAWVRAPAEGGRANAAILSLVARELGLPAKRLRIVKGARSPSKIVEALG
jgi:uncharacterized protein YggU (UPF0235/DUF167 family)